MAVGGRGNWETWTGELGDLDTHLEGPNHRYRCDFEPVLCKYARVGYEEKPLRKYVKKHEEDVRLHFQVTTDEVQELTKMNFISTCTLPRTINYLKHSVERQRSVLHAVLHSTHRTLATKCA